MLKRMLLLLALVSLSHAGEADIVVSFLRDMLENFKFESYPFLKSHCSEGLLKKLEADYDYECDEGPCYAVWNFRGGANDVWTWKVLDVRENGDGWYTYSFQENEFVGKYRVHAHLVKGSVILFDLKR